jgi:two-component system, response regulator PdtaR
MPSSTRPAVLIVEDEPLIRFAAADVLAETGLPVLEAGNADEALALLGAHPEIGLLFTDINMPGEMDGLRLAERVHETRPNIRLVVTSGKQWLSDDQIPDDGVFLSKPYRAQQLLHAVRSQLGR